MIETLAQRVGVEVRHEGDSFVGQASRLPLAQNRTSKNKAYVYVSRESIFKGPYTDHSLHLINNLRYPYLIECLENVLQLPLSSRGVLCWRTLHVCPTSDGTCYYLSVENIGNPDRMQVRPAKTMVDASFEVIERGSMLRRVMEIEKVKRGSRWVGHPAFDVCVAIASLQHLYLRYLFNVGDSGTHNILIREDRATNGRPIAGIDFDALRRDEEPRTHWDCLFKTGFDYQESLYGDLLPQVVLLDSLDAALQTEIEKLNALCRSRFDVLIDREEVAKRIDRLRVWMRR